MTTKTVDPKGCESWAGPVCIVSVEFLDATATDPKHLPIRLVADRDSILIYSQAGDFVPRKFDEVDCQNPAIIISPNKDAFEDSQSLGAAPLRNAHFTGRAKKQAQNETCFRFNIKKAGKRDVDPHIIVESN